MSEKISEKICRDKFSTSKRKVEEFAYVAIVASDGCWFLNNLTYNKKYVNS